MNVLERHKAWVLRNAVVIPTKFVSSMCSYNREDCCFSQSLKSEHRNTRKAKHNNNDLHGHMDTGRNGHRDTVFKNSHSNQNTGIQGKPGTTTTTFTGIGTQGGMSIGTQRGKTFCRNTTAFLNAHVYTSFF